MQLLANTPTGWVAETLTATALSSAPAPASAGQVEIFLRPVPLK